MERFEANFSNPIHGRTLAGPLPKGATVLGTVVRSGTGREGMPIESSTAGLVELADGRWAQVTGGKVCPLPHYVKKIEIGRERGIY